MLLFLEKGKEGKGMEQQHSLPKNIRQIGQVDKKTEIYIEDYVITFAHKLAKQEENKMGMAVLLGNPPKKEEKTPVFIKGAVKIIGIEENQSAIFTNKFKYKTVGSSLKPNTAFGEDLD